jgi:hypothetical protein
LESYKNLNGNSGIVCYELSEGAILVEFSNGWLYEYTNASAGRDAIATMHRLAAAGRGLSGFISTTVHDRYSRKTPRETDR